MSAPDEEYILRWNDHGVSFFSLADDLLQRELLTDVSIWCGERVFDAHRLVLCACSPYFRAMLTRLPKNGGQMGQPIVFLKDVSPVHFERLLQFMYCGEVRVPNGELETLIQAATSLKIRGLATAKEEKQTELQNSVLDINTTTTTSNSTPAQPPKKRRLSGGVSRKSPPPRTVVCSEDRTSPSLPPRATSSPIAREHNGKRPQHSHADLNTGVSTSPQESGVLTPLVLVKEEEEAVSPPPQNELVALVNETGSPPSLGPAGETPRILHPSEPRKTGTCYFCKKAFMKNKQLMNHVCPKKPRGGSNPPPPPPSVVGSNADSILLRRK